MAQQAFPFVFGEELSKQAFAKPPQEAPQDEDAERDDQSIEQED